MHIVLCESCHGALKYMPLPCPYSMVDQEPLPHTSYLLLPALTCLSADPPGGLARAPGYLPAALCSQQLWVFLLPALGGPSSSHMPQPVPAACSQSYPAVCDLVSSETPIPAQLPLSLSLTCCSCQCGARHEGGCSQDSVHAALGVERDIHTLRVEKGSAGCR